MFKGENDRLAVVCKETFFLPFWLCVPLKSLIFSLKMSGKFLVL